MGSGTVHKGAQHISAPSSPSAKQMRLLPKTFPAVTMAEMMLTSLHATPWTATLKQPGVQNLCGVALGQRADEAMGVGQPRCFLYLCLQKRVAVLRLP